MDLYQSARLAVLALAGLVALAGLPVAASAQDEADFLDISLRLDRLVYEDGASVEARLSFRKWVPPEDRLPVFVVAPKTQDVEILAVVRDRASRREFRAEAQVRIQASGRSGRFDGVLSTEPGEILTALYHPPDAIVRGWPDGVGAVADIALVADPQQRGPEIRVAPELRFGVPEGRRADGVLIGTAVQNGAIGQLAANELIVMPRSAEELREILARTGGEVRASSGRRESRDAPVETSYLVRVDPARGERRHLEQLRALVQEKTPLIASRPEVLGLYALALELVLDGYQVMLNPLLQETGPPTTPEETAGGLGPNVLNAASLRPNSSSWPDDPRFFDVPQVWSFMALWDVVGEEKDRLVPVAFIDRGFAPNEDFRRMGDTPLLECDVRADLWEDIVCESGAATGTSNGRWHGNGVVSSAGAVVNNDYGSGGTGGQLVVPQLFSSELNSWWRMAQAIRRAVDEGASAVSISSAAALCSLSTTVGVFEWCDPVGRNLLCVALLAAIEASKVITCSVATVELLTPLGFVTGYAGTKACLAGHGAAALTVVGCIASLVIGDPRTPLDEAVDYATENGVPVVACAGNDPQPMVQPYIDDGTLPTWIADQLDLTDKRISSWGVQPGMLPGVITVGAVTTSASAGFPNAHLFGPEVEIWAPMGSAYMKPSGSTVVESSAQAQDIFSGSSDATPYITGLVANAMALDPTLRPTNEDLSADERSAIPSRLRELLVSTARSADDLTALGLADDGERANVVDPMAFLMAAARGRIPDVVYTGYDRSANVTERISPNDTTGTAVPLAGRNPRHSGTIMFLPGEEGAPDLSDVDWFSLEPPLRDGPHLRAVVLTVPAPERFGSLVLEGPGWRHEARTTLQSTGEVADTYTNLVLRRQPGPLFFRIIGERPDSDNVYKLGVEPVRGILPPPRDRFDPVPVTVSLGNDLPTVASSLGDGSGGSGAWRDRGPGAYQLQVADLTIHAPDDVDWFSLDALPGLPPGSCAPELSIGFGETLRLTAYAPSGQPLLVSERPPARLPESLLALPLRFKLETRAEGGGAEYALSLEYAGRSGAECDRRRAAGDLPRLTSGRTHFPHYHPAGDDTSRAGVAIEAAAGAQPAREPIPRRQLDRAGRLTTPDRYAIDWDGSGTFRLRAGIEESGSLRVRLLDARGTLVQQAEVGLARAEGETAPRENPSRDLVLRVPGLPRGPYVVELSHARPGSWLDVWISGSPWPTGVATRSTATR